MGLLLASAGIGGEIRGRTQRGVLASEGGASIRGKIERPLGCDETSARRYERGKQPSPYRRCAKGAGLISFESLSKRSSACSRGMFIT